MYKKYDRKQYRDEQSYEMSKKGCKKECKKEQEIAYYQCAMPKDGYRKCHKFIEKTFRLIDEIELLNEAVGQELLTAAENQGLAVADIGTIENDLTNIENTLSGIETALGEAQELLSAVMTQLTEVVMPAQNMAAAAIENAMQEQAEIEEVIECLEGSFEKTVKCLKKSAPSCPILIPEPVYCEEEWEDECDCEWEEDFE